MSITNPAIRRKLPTTEVAVANGEEAATHDEQHTTKETETTHPHDYIDTVMEEEEEGQVAQLKQLRRGFQRNIDIVNDMMIEYLSINILSKETILAFGELRGHYLVIINSINRDISDAEQG